MIIDNLADTGLFIDTKTTCSITISPELNKDGVLSEDNFGNNLISIIDSGYTPLGMLVKYHGGSGLLIHNTSTQQHGVFVEGDVIGIPVDFDKGLRYYLDAEVVYPQGRDNDKFIVDLKGKRIFKISVDGKNITNYSQTTDGIIIKGVDALLLDRFSELVVYIYSDTPPQNYGDIVAQISYKQYRSIEVWDNNEEGLDTSYLEGGEVLEVNTFEKLNISPTVTHTEIGRPFSSGYDFITNSSNLKVSLDIFFASEEVPIDKYVGDSEFRLVLSNPIFGRCILVNNCRLDGTDGLTLDKAKNVANISIRASNLVDILVSKSTTYGEDEYSKGGFGKNILVKRI
ncbi:MAG: hypothetical protein ACRCZ0_08310 [Cetobacterium sp.]